RIADISGAPVRAGATSAVREAENHDEFLTRARTEAGVEVEVISGVEEARLIHLGVLQALTVFDRRLLLCDIGGGSTEIVVGEGGDVLTAASLKLGAVRLTSRFFPGDLLHPSAVASCRRYVAAMLVDIARRVDKLGFEVAAGSSGTIEQMVRLVHAATGEDPLQTWNGATVTAKQLRAVTTRLVKARAKGVLDAGAVDGLDAKRADIIVAGALILEGVVEALGIRDLSFSEYALREGVLLDTANRTMGGSLHHLRDVSRRSVEHLAAAMDEDSAHSAHVAHLALQLFDATAALHGLGAGAADYLEAGALLANVGLAVAHDKHHKHSYYVIRHSDRLAGLTDGEIEVIAQIARYHRKSAPKPTHPEFAALSPEDQFVVRTCAAILRVAIGLDRDHEARVRRLEVEVDDDRLLIQAVADAGVDIDLELYVAAERSGLLQEMIGRKVEVVAGSS
ncbi:MAG: Ppx/GppA phosphatase family protein, partial [Acidimicrobiales bacterium]